MEDSLSIKQNQDGSYEMSWDKNDPNWKFMNHLTEAQIQDIISKEIKSKIEKSNDNP